MKPCIDGGFDISCCSALGFQGNDDFRQSFYQCYDSTFMMDTHNRAAFHAAVLFFKHWIVCFPVRELPPESLSAPAFLMAVWFSLSFHRQCGDIQNFPLEQPIQCAAGAVNRTVTTTNNHIRRPSLCDFFFHIRALIIWQCRLFSATALLVCFVALVEIQCGVAVFQKSNHIVDGLTGPTNLF